MTQTTDSPPKWTPYVRRSDALPDATPLELVARARQHLDAGDDRQWAGALWAAIRLTFLDLAARHDLAGEDFIADSKAGQVDDDEYIPIAKALDAMDNSGRKLHYRGNLGGGRGLRHHQLIGAYKEYWWEDIHTDTLAFIAECYDAAP